MNGKKHVFKMVPGKVFNKINDIELRSVRESEVDGILARVDFIGLDDKSGIMLDSPLEFCRTIIYNRTPGIYCIKEDEGELNLCTLKCGLDSATEEKIYDGNVQIELKKILFSTESKGYRASISNKDGSCMMHKVINRTDFDPERSNEINYLYKFFPEFSLAYLGDKLVKLGFHANFGREPLLFYLPLPLEYQYITLELGEDNTHQFYFSDEQGNLIEYLTREGEKDTNISYYDIGVIQEEVILSDAFITFLIKSLTNDQLKTLAYTLSNEQLQKIIPELSSNQLQVLAENLTDEQLQTLVNHLTNHQLQTLAQELNPEKLQIIVPILNDAQLEALVRDLNPEQVKEILPHLKVDQFKALIKTLNDEQFTVLAKDLAEHHLTILSKELEGDQLKALVNSLQEEQLKDLVNKLDPEKLEAIAQDLTDSNKIQIIIKSLADNPDKLQAFARNMSNEQFKELLDNVGAEELKDIIHKLPYEKVTAVIGDLGNQDQSKAIIDALKGELDEQSKQNKEMIEMLKQIKDDMPEIGQAPDFTIVDINNDSLLFV